MKYHDAIIDLIYYILKQGKTYLDYIDSGNAYDKIIRNYHQFNSKGEKVYRSKILMKQYYRISEKAWDCLNNNSEIYFEHVYPVKLIKEELKSLIDKNIVTKENIKYILDKTEIVVITKSEAKILDEMYKDSTPINGNDRLTEMNIIIKEETEQNNLFRMTN